jgi:hypothetical protein
MSDKNLSVLSIFLTGVGAGIALAVFLVPRFGAATSHLIGCKAAEREKPPAGTPVVGEGR